MKKEMLEKAIVECINDSKDTQNSRIVSNLWNYIFPKRGQCYTVRGYQLYNSNNIYLEEIINNPVPTKQGPRIELGFRSERFRELLPPMEIQEALDSCEPILIER